MNPFAGAFRPSGNATVSLGGSTRVWSDFYVDNIRVNGNAITARNTNGSVELNPNGTGSVHPGTDNTWSCGSSGNRWTDVYAVSGSVNTSDEREKMDIHNIHENALDLVNRLRPISYHWKNENPDKKVIKKHYGFVAQELEQILPDLIDKPSDYYSTEADEFNRLGMRPSYLIPFLVKSIQELSAQIEVIKNVPSIKQHLT